MRWTQEACRCTRSASARRVAAPDFEVLDVSAGEAALADSSVDISVAAVNRGGAAAFDLRVLENGRPIDLRRVMPAADGSPVRAVFTVTPARETATLYTVEIPSALGERRARKQSPQRARRAARPAPADSDDRRSAWIRAFVHQAGAERRSGIRDRFGRPQGTRHARCRHLFRPGEPRRAPRDSRPDFPRSAPRCIEYDAVVLANVEADALSRQQLQMLADFVDQRGGGLLVFGGKSFAQQGFAGTPLEDVLPLRLTDRGNGVVRAANRPESRT